ncbi:MAG TPA: hypothetical protein VE221_09875 [Sphingomicrobium sp.]|jgi:hypothetical protein|nr:hypothetical protein [Sphingomicrobium sp.]
MPVLRYFVFVGAALIALLFVVSAELPSAPAVEASNSATDLTSIRIHSDRKWPERVVFDTNAPTIVPAPVQTASVAPRVAAPEHIADTSAKLTARDAYAQVTPSDLKKPAAKAVHKRRVAKRRMPPPTIVVAQRPQFGLFANNIW